MPRNTTRYSKEWRLDRVRGISRAPVPAGPVREHVRQLLARGVTQRLVADFAGVGESTVSNLLLGRSATLQRPVADRLLAATVDLASAPEGVLVPRLGSVRRVQALMALGWRHSDLYERCGLRTSLVLSQAGDQVTVAKAGIIRALYAELHNQPGPSALTSRRALAAGYAPPRLWDGEDLDDPDTWPRPAVPLARAPREPGTVWRRVHLDDVEHLLAQGLPAWEVAASLGTTVDGLEIACRRGDRPDLREQLLRSREGAA